MIQTTINKQLNTTKTLYSFCVTNRNKQQEHKNNLLIYHTLIKDTDNKKAIDFFINAIQQQETLINDTINNINLLYKHNNIMLTAYYNTNYSVLQNINDKLRELHYLIKYQKDNNEYILLSKKSNVFRKTNISHLIEKMYSKRYITKNSYRKYKKYGFISNEIKQRINIYLRNSLLKIGHKKHYKSLWNNRKNQNLFYIPIIKQYLKFRKNINPSQFKNELLYSEIQKRQDAEIKYNTYKK